MSVDADKDLVAVTGTMDVKEMVPYLKGRLKRNVDVVPPPPAKKDGGGDGDGKKEKETPKEAAPDGGKKKEGGGGGEKKEEAPKDAKKDEGNPPPKVEVNKMEYHGYQLAPQSHIYDGHMYGQNFAIQPYQYHGGYPNQGNATHHVSDGYVNDGYGYGYGYGSTSMMPDPRFHMMNVNPRLHAPQMFSDENPNACSIM